ncbi:MAG: hypothetical protein ACKVH8_00925 [Pirellulales bacterium]
MRVAKVISAEDFKLIDSFDEVKKTLLDDTQFTDRLDKPLAYWALPNDRRLPLAFLGRSIGDLLKTPFEELSATPGIGSKKISSLVRLLNRATQNEEPNVPYGVTEDAHPESAGILTELPLTVEGKFDHTLVSEVMWTRWQETVSRHNLGHEKLGRLAPSLEDLPTVIWNAPLAFYLDYTVSEIRRLKTHGEKRVSVVLEVFFRIHQMLDLAQTQPHLTIELRPAFAPKLESWITEKLLSDGFPSDDEVREKLTLPLLSQVKIDVGSTVYELCAGRLGINGEPQSVRNQSSDMNVTRARVYQQLEDCTKVLQVRWAEGTGLLQSLVKKHAEDKVNSKLFSSTVDLFFPAKGTLSQAEAN